MNKHIITIMIAAVLIFNACRKPSINAPINLSYTTTKTVVDAGTAGSVTAPSIDWGGGTGSFFISKIVTTYDYTNGTNPVATKLTNTDFSGGQTGFSIDANTGQISWTAKAPAGKYVVSVVAANDAGSSKTADVTVWLSGFTFGELSTGKPQAITKTLVNTAKGTKLTAGKFEPVGLFTEKTIGKYSIKSVSPDSVNTSFTIDENTGKISWNATIKKGVDTIVIKNSTCNNTMNVILTVEDSSKSFEYKADKNKKTVNYNAADASSEAPTPTNFSSDTLPYRISSIQVTNYTTAIQSASSYDGITISDKGVITVAKKVLPGTYAVNVINDKAGAITSVYTFTVTDLKIESNTETAHLVATSKPVIYIESILGVKGNFYINNIEVKLSGETTATTKTAIAGISMDPVTDCIKWPSTGLAIGEYAINVKNYKSTSILTFTLKVTQ